MQVRLVEFILFQRKIVTCITCYRLLPPTAHAVGGVLQQTNTAVVAVIEASSHRVDVLQECIVTILPDAPGRSAVDAETP